MIGQRRKRSEKRLQLFAGVPLFMIIAAIALRSLIATIILRSIDERIADFGWKPSDDSIVIQPKETVVFEVSYLFFKLGTVRFDLLGKQNCHGVEAYTMRAFIDSYSGVPFVDLHSVYETCADAKTLMCLSTSNDQEEGDDWVHTNYFFNYPKRTLEWEQSVKGVVTKKVDLPLDTTYTDGLSFFYFVRRACARSEGRELKMTIPIVSDTVRSSVTLRINEKREPCDVEAFDFPIEAERISGHINFKGTFGVTGEFVGWISTDSAEVPLRAELKVVLGSIVVNLKEIRREGWDPPKAG